MPRAMRGRRCWLRRSKLGEAVERIDRLDAVRRRTPGRHRAGREPDRWRGEAGLRQHRQPLRLRLGENGVGDHRDQRGVSRWRWPPSPPLARIARMSSVKTAGMPRAAELAVQLVGRRPEPRAVADGDAADGVDHRERGDAHAVGQFRRGRAQPALEVDRGGAEARAGGAEREIIACALAGRIAEVAIGREAAPLLVAAVE